MEGVLLVFYGFRKAEIVFCQVYILSDLGYILMVVTSAHDKMFADKF
jgi:hypothetical protein